MKKNQGFIKIIIIIIVALVILSYFRIDIRKAVESPTTKENVSYVQEVGQNAWENVLKEPITSVWKNILAPLLTNIF